MAPTYKLLKHGTVILPIMMFVSFLCTASGCASLSTTSAREVKESAKIQETPAIQDAVKAIRLKQYTKSVAILTPLAEQGEPKAQELLGVHYLFGLGVKKDQGLGLQWLLRAAAQDDPVAP